MKTISRNDDLHELFLNVRKAYRLLYEYQKKLLKLAKFIADYYNYPTVVFESIPWFSNRNKENSDFNNWAWDWLNMYDHEFRMFDKKNSNVKFSIRIINDTGFYDSGYLKKERTKKERTKLKDFVEVERSKTLLIMIAGDKKFWDPIKLLSKKYPFRRDSKKINKDKGEKYFENDNEFILKKDNKTIMYAKVYPLEAFIDKESTKEKLEDFREKCKENGINI